MRDKELLEIVQYALGTFEHRQSYSPGMFEPLKPLFKSMDYRSVAVYIADDYPDRMRRVSGYGGGWFPDHVTLNGSRSLFDALKHRVKDVPGVLAARLFSHERELGALAVTVDDSEDARTRDAFNMLAKSMSIMAYVERIRTNGRRERQERDIFFAQSLTNRLLIRKLPEVKGLRLGSKFLRSLDAGGDFFDMIALKDGLRGMIGSCNGKGLRTVLGVTDIMRETHRACQSTDNLAEVLLYINNLLIHDKGRAHQASLCLFEICMKKKVLRLAQSGKLGLFLCGPGGRIRDIASTRDMFLGMIPDLEIREETFDFAPGQSLVCLTEGFYAYRNCMNVSLAPRWFEQAFEAALISKSPKPLVNTLFDSMDEAADFNSVIRTVDSMLVLSVEFTGK